MSAAADRRPRRTVGGIAAAAVVLAVVMAGGFAIGGVPAAHAEPTTPAADPCTSVAVGLRPACYAARAAGAALPAGAHAALAGGVAGGVAAGVVGGVADSALDALTGFVVDGAVWFLEQVAGAVTGSTTVSVTSAWYTRHYRVMAGIAASFALLFLLLTAAATVVHQNPGRVVRAVVAVATAGIGTAIATVVTQLLLRVSDELSGVVAHGLTGDLRAALTGAAHGLTTLGVHVGAPGIPAFAGLVAGFVAALAAVVIWIELLLRDVAIYATLLFFPVALAGLAWPPSRMWARRLAELLTALIFAKFVIVAVLSLAAGGLAAGREGYAGVLSGAALLLVAAFSPFLLLRVIAVFEVAVAAAALDGARQRGTRPVVHTGQAMLHTIQRHRLVATSPGGGVTVAAAAPWTVGAVTTPAGATRPGRGAAPGTAPIPPDAGRPGASPGRDDTSERCGTGDDR